MNTLVFYTKLRKQFWCIRLSLWILRHLWFLSTNTQHFVEFGSTCAVNSKSVKYCVNWDCWVDSCVGTAPLGKLWGDGPLKGKVYLCWSANCNITVRGGVWEIHCMSEAQLSTQQACWRGLWVGQMHGPGPFQNWQHRVSWSTIIMTYHRDISSWYIMRIYHEKLSRKGFISGYAYGCGYGYAYRYGYEYDYGYGYGTWYLVVPGVTLH